MRPSTSFPATLALVAAIATSAHAQPTLGDAATRRIDSVFAVYNSKTSPGCATSVIRDGVSVFEKGYGMSNLEYGIPITPASIFHVASISKQFTAFSIALLASEGKLNVDDNIRKYLPEVPDFGTPITIRHLLNHTSGLRDQWSLLGLSGWRGDDPKSEADILWLVSRQRALNFTPGSEHLYSNTGFTLLGVIVHRVSGRTLRQFTTERIFTPLGMTNTHFHDDHTMIVPNRTSAYVPRGSARGAGAGVDAFEISIPVFDNAGATSLFTTVQDMARWDANFLSPKIGDAKVMALMHERGKLNDGTVIPYASALVHGEVRGLKTVGHDGADAGYRAAYIRFLEQRYAFVTMCNIGTVNPAQLNLALAEIVLGDRMTAPPTRAAATTPTEVAMAPEQLKKLAGIYVDKKTFTTSEVIYNDSARALYVGRAANAPRLTHVGNSEFTVPGNNAPRFRIADGRMVAVANNQMDGTKADAASLTPATRRELAGRYRSEELDVDWTVTVVGDSTLMLSRRHIPDQRMIPVYRDGFIAGVGSMRFTRNATGKVTGFLLTAGRVRNIQFEKLP